VTTYKAVTVPRSRPSGRPDRGPDDPHVDRGEHGIESGGELGIPVPDQELQAVSGMLKVHQEVADPLTRCAGGDPGQVHAPGAVLDEEQHVQAAQKSRAGVEGVRGEDRRGLPGQERPPGLPGPLKVRVDAGVLEDLPHRRRRHRVSQAGQSGVPVQHGPGREIGHSWRR
jgi:hypothetical protein